ncbi:hypothetical protein HD554DRAFT_2168946 [Boletus coccyginus]|nr:hypothetical protein HD554DRAFT_2168946 [Boletus coccyginus]
MVYSTGMASPDILAYRYEGELVYVLVAPDYTQALSHAYDVFPQLKGLGDVSLSLSMTMAGIMPQFVRISTLAWPKLIVQMSRYQIIQVTQAHERDIAVPLPDITTTHADVDDMEEAEPAPPYCRSDGEKVLHPCPQQPSMPEIPPKRRWFLRSSMDSEPWIVFVPLVYFRHYLQTTSDS